MLFKLLTDAQTFKSDTDSLWKDFTDEFDG